MRVALRHTSYQNWGTLCAPPPPNPGLRAMTGHRVWSYTVQNMSFMIKVDQRHGTRGTFDIVSPPLENVVGWGRETRPFHSFKGEVQICQRWSMRVRSLYGMSAGPIKGPGKFCILDAPRCNIGTILRGNLISVHHPSKSCVILCPQD